MNECTHFACIMDPKFGTIRWLEQMEFVECESEDEDEDEHHDPELLETVTTEPEQSCHEVSSISENSGG